MWQKLTRFWTSKNLTSVWSFSLVLLVLILIRFWPMVFQAKTLFFGDNYSLMVPGKLFLAEWLKQGVIPFWNPYNFGGLSVVGDINQSLWYPSTLLFYWMSPATALNLTIIGQILLAGVGSYLLVHKITKHHGAAMLAGIWWAFSTQVSGTVNNLSTIQSIVWLPWIMLVGLRVATNNRAKLSMAVLVAVQFAGGYPQHVLFSVLAAGLLALYQEFGLTPQDGLAGLGVVKNKKLFDWLKHWLIAGLLVIGLSAVFWWPFLETLGLSTRETQTISQSQAGSLHPSDLIKLVVPYFFDNPVAGIKWGPQWNGMPNLSLYFGWLGLVLPIMWFGLKQFKRWDWFMAGVIFVSLLFALGGNLPGFTQLQALLPILQASRGPSTVMMVTNIFWIIWLGSLLARNWPQVKSWRKWLTLTGLAISLISAGLWYVGVNSFDQIWQFAVGILGPKLAESPFHTLERDQLIWLSIFSNLTVNAIGFVLAHYLWQKRQWLGLAVIVAADMMFNTRSSFLLAPTSIYLTADQLNQTAAARILPEDFQARTLIRNYNYPYTDFGAYWDAIKVREPFSDSYIDAEELKNFTHLTRYAKGLTPDWNQAAGVAAINGYTTLLPQAVQTTWAPDFAAASINNLPQIELDHQALKPWAVKYYLVDHWFGVTEDLSGLKKVASLEWWDVYEFPGTFARVRWTESNLAADITHWQENPNQIRFEVANNSPEPQTLILADNYDQNWQAWIDGQSVQITNIQNQRQIFVPPGKHSVEFKFIPLRLVQGALVSGLSLVLALTLLVCLAKRK